MRRRARALSIPGWLIWISLSPLLGCGTGSIGEDLGSGGVAADPSKPTSDVPIFLYGLPKLWSETEADPDRISAAVRTALSARLTEKTKDGLGRIRRVDVKPLVVTKAEPAMVRAYLLFHGVYGYEAVNIRLSDGQIVPGAKAKGRTQRRDKAADRTYAGACPDETIEVLVSTPTKELGFESAVNAVNKAANFIANAGYRTKILCYTEDNSTAAKNWLGCKNLRLWFRVGHGSPEGIYFNGTDELGKAYFQSLAPGGLTGKSLYFNSCEVQKDPMASAVVGTGAQRYAGGVPMLAVGPSEEVAQCFLQAVVVDKKPMTQTLLTQCETQTGYPEPNAHKLTGAGPDALPPPADATPKPSPGQCELPDPNQNAGGIPGGIPGIPGGIPGNPGIPGMCNPGEFFCMNMQGCVQVQAICDGNVDCQDGSDEMFCGQAPGQNPGQVPGQGGAPCDIVCADQSSCIPVDYLCDGWFDCMDGWDEFFCGP